MQLRFDKNSTEVLRTIKSDINSNKKYLDKGYRLGGEVSGNKMLLQIIDNYGKSSVFMTPVFYGSVSDNSDGCEIKGTFRMKNSALILLAILFVVDAESIVTSFIFSKALADMVIPWVIFACIIVYLIAFKIGFGSKESKSMLSKYLRSLNEI